MEEFAHDGCVIFHNAVSLTYPFINSVLSYLIYI